jgi:hypothetical protein
MYIHHHQLLQILKYKNRNFMLKTINDLQGYMHTSQGSKASWLWKVRQWTETLPDM